VVGANIRVRPWRAASVRCSRSVACSRHACWVVWLSRPQSGRANAPSPCTSAWHSSWKIICATESSASSVASVPMISAPRPSVAA
jgi:hypothetical protein